MYCLSKLHIHKFSSPPLVAWAWALRLGALDSEFRHPDLERAKGCTQDKFLRDDEGPRSNNPTMLQRKGRKGCKKPWKDLMGFCKQSSGAHMM